MNYIKRIVAVLVGIILLGSCAPVAKFTYNDNVNKSAPATITFENKSKKAESFEWNFGDGKISNEETPSHQYFKPGTYTITLKAIKEGKISTQTQNITIESPEECLIELETAFGLFLLVKANFCCTLSGECKTVMARFWLPPGTWI